MNSNISFSVQIHQNCRLRESRKKMYQADKHLVQTFDKKVQFIFFIYIFLQLHSHNAFLIYFYDGEKKNKNE